MVVSVMGGGEKVSDGEISKTTTVGPLQFSYYTTLLPKVPVRSNMNIRHLIISPNCYEPSVVNILATKAGLVGTN